jgi:hypothetical protein
MKRVAVRFVLKTESTGKLNHRVKAESRGSPREFEIIREGRSVLLRAGRMRLTIATLLLPSWTALAGPLDTLQPGQWFEAPNSAMSAVDPCPSNTCVYSGSQKNVIGAWNSAAYDTRRNRLVVWGGGHGDYGGNEVYVFDVETLSWSRLTNPSTNIANNVDPYPDGRPNPRHTYGTPTYIPTADRYWVSGGSLWEDGSCRGDIWMYRFDALPPEDGWEHQVSSFGGTGFGDCGGLAAYDPDENRVLLLAKRDGTAQLVAFNPNNLSAPWTMLNANTDRLAYQMGVVDTKRRKLVVVGAGVTWTYDIDQSGAPHTVLSTSGATSIESANAPGLAYDPVSDRVVAWSGGQDVYTLDMDSRVWELRAPANGVDPGPVTASGGTWGRFRYVPSKNVFILVNSSTENVFFYKLSSATGIPAPQRPAKPSVTVR